MGDAHMALQARLMSQALRKLTGSLAKSNCLIIFINQIRQKVGILFGNPEVTPGGNALKFYSSIRMDIRRKTAIKKGEEVVGYETTVKVVKNKLAPPVPRGVLRHDVRHWHLARGRGVGSGAEGGAAGAERCLDQSQRREHRAGTREGEGVSRGEPRGLRRAGEGAARPSGRRSEKPPAPPTWRLLIIRMRGRARGPLKRRRIRFLRMQRVLRCLFVPTR